jgi:hypothetical protein
MDGRSPLRAVASVVRIETRGLTTSLSARHVVAVAVAVAASPMTRPALHATGQVASSWIQPPFPGRDEDSHDSSASPVSRHPRADRSPSPYLGRSAQPSGHRLEMALRNYPGLRPVSRSRRRDHLVRCYTDDRRAARHSPDNLVLAASPTVRSQPRLVHHHPAPSTRRLRRRTDLLQPRQDSDHPVDISSRVRRTSPAVLPGRHHRRRLRHCSNRPNSSLLGSGRSCLRRRTTHTTTNPRRHTPTI